MKSEIEKTNETNTEETLKNFLDMVLRTEKINTLLGLEERLAKRYKHTPTVMKAVNEEIQNIIGEL